MCIRMGHILPNLLVEFYKKEASMGLKVKYHLIKIFFKLATHSFLGARLASGGRPVLWKQSQCDLW